jgi:hypothetical protein
MQSSSQVKVELQWVARLRAQHDQVQQIGGETWESRVGKHCFVPVKLTPNQMLRIADQLKASLEP